MSKILALVGKSGSGKSFIQQELCKNPKYIKVISYTTRPPRDYETNMIDYYFVNDIVFEIMERRNQFVETYTAKNCDNWKYGFAKKSFDVDNNIAVAVVTPSGLRQLKEQYDDVYAIYITCPDEIRYSRIKNRESNFDEQEFERRKIQDEIDFRDIGEIIDDSILNDGTYTVDEIINCIKWIMEDE